MALKVTVESILTIKCHSCGSLRLISFQAVLEDDGVCHCIECSAPLFHVNHHPDAEQLEAADSCFYEYGDLEALNVLVSAKERASLGKDPECEAWKSIFSEFEEVKND